MSATEILVTAAQVAAGNRMEDHAWAVKVEPDHHVPNQLTIELEELRGPKHPVVKVSVEDWKRLLREQLAK